jgi:hypothetical protein
MPMAEAPGRKSSTALVVSIVGAAVVAGIVIIALASSKGAPPPEEVAARSDEPRRSIIPMPELPKKAAEPEKRPEEPVDAALLSLDTEAKAMHDREEFGAALDFFERSMKRHGATAWTEGLMKRMSETRSRADRLYTELKAKAVAAKQAAASTEVLEISARVGKWGLKELSSDLEKALVGIVKAAPEPAKEAAPVVPAPPAEPQAYLARWEEAIRLAAARDYATAVGLLEKMLPTLKEKAVIAEVADDIERLRQVSSLHAEGLQLFSRLPKGEKVTLEHLDPAGKPRTSEGIVGRTAAHWVELKREKESVWVDAGDLLGRSLASLYRSRPGAQPEREGPVIALFLLLDGEAEAAKALGAGPAAAKYAARASSRTGPTPEAVARETEARSRLQAMLEEERNLVEPQRRGGTAARCRALVKSFGDTWTVRLHRAVLEHLSAPSREYLFPPEDCRGSGSFRRSSSERVRDCWTGSSNVVGAQVLENYVELEFEALADAAYKCWIYAGACCAESAAFDFQATDLTEVHPRTKEAVSIEPGGKSALSAKVAIPGLPKGHSAHGGRIDAARWAWIAVPLPKYPAAGAKKLRLIAERQGISFSYAIVSAVRTATPTEAMVKELEAPEAARVERALAGAGPVGGLVGWWKLDEGSGQVAKDASGNGRHGQLENGAAWSGGKGVPGVSLDGGDDRVNIPGAVCHGIVDTFTMALWASPAATRNVTTEATTGAPGTKDQRYAVYPSHGQVYGAGHSGAGISIGTNGVSVFEHGPNYLPSLLVHDVEIQGWTHVAVVYAGRQPRLYVNGKPARTGKASEKSVHPSVLLGSEGPYGPYKGLLADYRLYNRALSASEVAALAKRRPGGK